MIYLVTRQQELFTNDTYKLISIQESLAMMKSWKVVQFDTETKGVDARISPVLCAQFGNKQADVQIVVDTTSVNLKLYKEILESKLVIGQNLYFDLQFLYNFGIICRRIYDTMIVEQLLYLGYPSKFDGGPSMGLAAISERRLDIYISKEIRGQIIWRGLDASVIQYAANDVVYLEDIMWSQIKECHEKCCLNAAKLECDFVPVIAYCSWCGIKLDETEWRAKMAKDEANLNNAIDQLNKFVIAKNNPKFIKVDRQGDLFTGFNIDPQCSFDWGRPGIKSKKEPVKEFIKYLGFDIKSIDKKTKELKDSIDIKSLKKQKGINDEFLKMYVNYSETLKVVTTYGITYINAINPNTGRIHTQFKQLAADTGRISCGNSEDSDSIKINPDLAILKGFPLKTTDVTKKCGYPNIQTLPADNDTRHAFISEKGNLFCSCDWSAIESRLGADIYNERAMIDEFLYGSGDMHSLVAKMIFPILKDIPVKDIKHLYPKLRNDAKPVEFSQQFGGSAEAIRNAIGCSVEEAQAFADAYNNGFKGIAEYKIKGSKFVRNNGYIILNSITGHKTYWWDWEKWKENQKSFTQSFWEDYRTYHKGTGDEIAITVRKHFQTASKWDRKALNSVTQGTGAICIKEAGTKFFYWLLDNNLFDIVKIINFVHDEICIEYPETMPYIADKLKEIMEEVSGKYCKQLPIPAEASVGLHWIH